MVTKISLYKNAICCSQDGTSFITNSKIIRRVVMPKVEDDCICSVWKEKLINFVLHRHCRQSNLCRRQDNRVCLKSSRQVFFFIKIRKLHFKNHLLWPQGLAIFRYFWVKRIYLWIYMSVVDALSSSAGLNYAQNGRWENLV